MAWELLITMKSRSGVLTVDFDSEEDARAALGRAQTALRNAMKGGPGSIAMFEDTHVVPATEVLAVSVREGRGPLIA